jgi:hypothetical protein
MNYFATRLSAFLLCFSSIILLHAMEEQNPIVPTKPVIKGFIYPQMLTYHAQAYHDQWNSVSNVYSHAFIPVVDVNVLYADEGYPVEFDWTQGTPKVIYTYEKWNWKHPDNKKFPQYVPLTLFYNKQEGDILSLRIHGYEARLTCTSQLPIAIFKDQPEDTGGIGYACTYNKDRVAADKNFTARLNSLIENFTNKIFQINHKDYDQTIVQFCIEHKIIEPKDGSDINYTHGENGFKDLKTSMILLIMEQIEQKNQIAPILLLLLIKK